MANAFPISLWLFAQKGSSVLHAKLISTRKPASLQLFLMFPAALDCLQRFFFLVFGFKGHARV